MPEAPPEAPPALSNGAGGNGRPQSDSIQALTVEQVLAAAACCSTQKLYLSSVHDGKAAAHASMLQAGLLHPPQQAQVQ